MSVSRSTNQAGSDLLPATVRVWDPFVRFFHWSLVAFFTFAFVTGDEWNKAHEIAGYVIAGLVASRVLWGIIGTRYARFSNFIYRPSTIVGFARDSMTLKAKRYLGHNPAGGIMVVALLLAITAISVTGYMLTLDAFWGVEWVEEAHEAAAYGTLVLIGLHVAGVVFSSFEHRENLVKSMFIGHKRR